MAAVRETFSRPEYEVRTFFPDAKTNPEEGFLRRRADESSTRIWLTCHPAAARMVRSRRPAGFMRLP